MLVHRPRRSRSELLNVSGQVGNPLRLLFRALVVERMFETHQYESAPVRFDVRLRQPRTTATCSANVKRLIQSRTRR